MLMNDMTIKLAGEAGQGVESSGAGFTKALVRGGLHVFGLPDYMSRIRGGHNSFQIRVAENPLYSHTDELHLLLALNPEAVEIHRDEMAAGGGVIYDERFEVDGAELAARGLKAFPVPLAQIAQEEGGSKVMANTAALGAAAGVTEYDLQQVAGVIQDNFARKGDAVVSANLKVARRAYEHARDRYAASFGYRLKPVEAPPRMVIHGNQALCLGALAAGCRFVSAYPMTPASSIIEWMSAHAARYGIVTKHTEDEIAAICMAIGAAHVGTRAMTATSGGGFALMVEALGLASMTETPLVIAEVQRAGPSTGMPTRTEQGDLLFVLNASQGEFPLIVLAPGTVEECFQAGWRAFNLAEKCQCPVIVLSDTYLAGSLRSVDSETFDLAGVEIDRGDLLTAEQLDELSDGYRRYAVTESGISPRALPGHPNAVHIASSDEHDELGHIEDEDPVNRVRMTQKRQRKLASAAREMNRPTRYGPTDAATTLVCWGSTYGPAKEAVDRLNRTNGKPASFNLLHFMDIWPWPEEEVARALQAAGRLVAVENNATGQFARLLRAHTGRLVDGSILRFDGRPLSPDYIQARLEEVSGDG